MFSRRSRITTSCYWRRKDQHEARRFRPSTIFPVPRGGSRGRDPLLVVSNCGAPQKPLLENRVVFVHCVIMTSSCIYLSKTILLKALFHFLQMSLSLFKCETLVFSGSCIYLKLFFKMF